MVELLAAVAAMLGALTPKSALARASLGCGSALLLATAVALGVLELLAWLGY